jgi:excisionase family DNA binding protein
MSEKLYDVKAAAPLLSLSESSVYSLCARHLIRHIRVGAGGGGIRIPESAIAEYLKRREIGVGFAPTADALTHIRRSQAG